MRTIPCAGRREGRVSDFQATHVRRSQRARRPQLQAWILHIWQLLLYFCTCRDMSKMEEDPMIPQVQEYIVHHFGCNFLCSSLIFFSLQRMRDITRTQLCTKEVSGHNLNLKSLFSVLSTTCTNLERRIVVFCIRIFRWPNFLNVPKPTDSPL